MTSPSPPLPSAVPDTPIPDDVYADSALPLPMSASVILSSLPIDAQTAMANADDMEGRKGMFSLTA